MVLGMEFFAFTVFYDENGKIVNSAAEGAPPQRNFDTVFASFVTVFSILIGDNWNSIMYEF